MKKIAGLAIGAIVAVTVATGCSGAVDIEKYESALNAKSECLSQLNAAQQRASSCSDELERCKRAASGGGGGAAPAASGAAVPAASIQLISEYLKRLNWNHNVVDDQTITSYYNGTRKRFAVNIRYFKNVEVVYMVADEFIKLPNIGSSEDMNKACLLLSKAMDINYQETIGKLEFNTKTGALKYSIVLNTDDGLGFNTFKNTFQTLYKKADERYIELADFMRENGYPIE